MYRTRPVIILERTEVFKGQKDHLVYMVFLLPDRLTKAVFVYHLQGVLNETIQNNDQRTDKTLPRRFVEMRLNKYGGFRFMRFDSSC